MMLAPPLATTRCSMIQEELIEAVRACRRPMGLRGAAQLKLGASQWQGRFVGFGAWHHPTMIMGLTQN